MISVLLPTYNQARFLPACLDSLAAQTRRDFEVIACNDGSTDETTHILFGRGIKTVLHDRNEGTAAAINSAAAVMSDSSRFVTWVSSDNVMHPEWLKKLTAALRRNRDWGAAYSDFVNCEAGIASAVKNARPKVVRGGPYRRDRLVGGENCYFGPSFLVRREVWQEHRGGTAHDYDSWARIEEASWSRGWAVGYVEEPLCDYRHGDWNTVLRRPELYDAAHWRAEALERRKWKRNWLGKLVAARVRESDEVLDLGCGIMPATGGRLACKRHVGVDSFKPYLDRVGPPTIHGRLPDAIRQFNGGTYDVVLLLDVLEHLTKMDAMDVLCHAEVIARREVIVFTPDGFVPQQGYAAWGMGENPDQAHRCGFTFDELTAMGYQCMRHDNGTEQRGAITSVLGVKCV